MNDWTASQIKTIVDDKIVDERRYRDALRQEDHRWSELKFNELAKALALQAKEYERRLDVLNHAHAEAQRVLGTYMPREVYERAHAEVVEWQRKADIDNVEIDNRIKSVELGLVNLPGGVKSLELGLAAQTGQQLGSRMTMTTAVALIGTAMAVLGGLFLLLNYLKP